MVSNASDLERRRSTIVPSLIFSNSYNVEVKEADDYVMENFTPGMHSPNIYSVRCESEHGEEEKDLLSSKGSDIFEDLGLDFATVESFDDISNLEWKPLKIQEPLIKHVLNEYFRFIPSIIKSVFPSIDVLRQEVNTGIDPSWYWGLKNDKILGLLIYTLDSSTLAGRNLNIHHISCLHERSFQSLIDSATKFLFAIDSCDDIRVNLFTEIGRELPSDVKKIFTNLKFK